MSGYHDDEEEYEPYEEDEEYDAYEEDELAARGGAVQIAPRAFSLGSDGEDEEDEDDDEEDDDEEDAEDADRRIMPPPPSRATRGPGVPSSSGRDYAAAMTGRRDEAEEDEEDEEDDENEALFGDGADLETYLKDAGPNSYNILADRRRKALKQSHAAEAAFTKELEVRGYSDSQSLLDVADADRFALISKNPMYKMFFEGATTQTTNAARGNLGRGKTRRGIRRTRKRVISAEAAKKLGDANMLFTMGEANYPQAIELLTEVIRLIPNEPDAYATLGTIYNELKNDKKALDFLMISAHLEPGNKDKWNNLAEMSIRLNNPRQALYCLGQALRLDSKDLDNRWDQARLYMDIGEPKRALEQFQILREQIPDNSSVAVELAKLHYGMGNPDAAEETLDTMMETFPRSADATLVNILAELKMDRRKFDETVTIIESTREHMISLTLRDREAEHAKLVNTAAINAYNAAIDEGADEDACNAALNAAKAETAAKLASEREAKPADIPLDLTTRLGMSLLYLRRFDEAHEQLDKLKEEDVENFDDLYMDAAETLWAVANLVDVPAADSVRLATQAEFLWKKLLVIPAHDDETLWSKIARCIRVRIEWDGGGASAAAAAVVEFYQAVSGRHPDSVRAKIPLAEALVSANRGDEACAMLPAASDLDDLDKADALRVLDVHRQTGGDDDFLRYTLPIARQSLDDFKDREEAKQETKGRGKKGKGGRGKKRGRAGNGDASDLFKLGPRDRKKQRVEFEDDEEDVDEEEEDELELQKELDAAAAALEGPGDETDAINEEDSFGIILRCASALHESRRHEEARAMIEQCLAQSKSRSLSKTQVRDLHHVKALVCHALGAQGVKGMKAEAAEAARQVALKNSTDADALNLYARLAMDAQQRSRCAKTFQAIVSMHDVREGMERKKRVPALIMSGIVHSQQGAWATALADLMHAVALGPEESTAALSGGIAALQYSMKHIEVPEARHHWVLKAVAMLQHAGRLRAKEPGAGGRHEGDYNLARGLQQLGLNHLAVPLYERCLEMGAGELQTECAQNLSLIYEQSGATVLRDQVLREYKVSS